ncbi:MAG: hypothetical protein ABIK96_09175, partial [bacterium]
QLAVEARLNGEPLDLVPVQRGRFALRLRLEAGRNEIRLRMIGLQSVFPHAIAQPVSFALVYLPGGDRVSVSLMWPADYAQVPDLDLHLIGPDGDDCFYANPSPEWGIPGEGSDNPLLVTPEPQYISTGYYMTETIGIADPAPGLYQVKVHNYDALGDTVSVSPQVTVTLDGTERAFTMGNGRRLREDEVWDVTSLNIASAKGVARGGRGPVSGSRISRALLPPKQR